MPAPTHHQPLKAQVSPDLDLEPDLPWPFFSFIAGDGAGSDAPLCIFVLFFEMGPLAEVCATYIDESMQAGRLTSSAVWTRWQTPTFDMCICNALIAVSTGTYQFTIHRRANPKFIHHGSGYLDRSCSGVDVGSSIRLFSASQGIVSIPARPGQLQLLVQLPRHCKSQKNQRRESLSPCWPWGGIGISLSFAFLSEWEWFWLLHNPTPTVPGS